MVVGQPGKLVPVLRVVGSSPILVAKITTTRQTGGLLGAISPCYWPASKGAGFHFGLWEVCFAPSHSSIQAILRLTRRYPIKGYCYYCTLTLKRVFIFFNT